MRKLLPILLTALLGCAPAPQADYVAGDLAIHKPWSRPTMEGMPMGVAYLTIENRGDAADRLLGASSTVAEGVELHRTAMEEGMASMRPAGPVEIAPGATVNIEPEGLHFMLVGLKQPLAAGSTFPLELSFEKSGRVTIQVKVAPPTS
jgi:periplasmic copper chaperone A